MVYGGPFPAYPAREIGLEKLRAEYKAKRQRARAKRERLETEARAAYERYPEPHPDEVKAMQAEFAESEAEAEAIMTFRMDTLYPLGYKDVDLMEAWSRLPLEVSEELERDMTKEEGLRDLTHVLSGFLIYTDGYGGIDPRHVTEAWAAIGRMMPVLRPELVEPEVVEPEPVTPPFGFKALWPEEAYAPAVGPIKLETETGETIEAELREDNTIWRDNQHIATYDPRTGRIVEPEVEVEPTVEPALEEKWLTEIGREMWQELPISPYFWESPQERAEIEQRRVLEEWAKAEDIENPEEYVNQLLAQETGLVVMRAATDEMDYRPLPTMPVVYKGTGIPVTPGERVVGEWLIPIAAISWLPAFGAMQGWLSRHLGTLGRIVAKTLSPIVWAEKVPAKVIEAVARKVFKPKFPDLIEPEPYIKALKITHPERVKTKADADAIFQEIKQYNLYIREVAQNAPPPLMANLTRQGLSHELFKLKPIRGGLYDVTVRVPYIKPRVKDASMAIADVIGNPTAYNWTGKQGRIALNFARAYHQVEAALLSFEKKSGILIRERWYPSGEYHVGRNVVAEVDAKGNVILERILRRGRLGTKLSAERERVYLTQAEGIKGGKVYALPEESLNFRIQAAYDRAGGLSVKAQYLEMLSAKPSELLDVNIKQQWEALSRNYKDTIYINTVLQRAFREPPRFISAETVVAVTNRNPIMGKRLADILAGKVKRPKFEITKLTKQNQATMADAKAELRNFAPLYHRATAKAREAAFTEGRIWTYPAMQNRIFTDVVNPHNPNEILMTGREVVKRLNAIFTTQAGGKLDAALRTASDFSRVGVSLVAAMDGSWPFIQGPMSLGYDAASWATGKPSAVWAKSTFEMLKTMCNPRWHADFQLRHATTYTRAPLLSRATSEFVAGYGVLTKWAQKVPIIGGSLTKIINQTYGRMGAGFSGAAESSRVLLYEGMEKSWLKHGGDLTELQLLCNQLSGAVSLEYLGANPTSRALQSAGLFAPSFTRSWLMNLRDLCRGTMKAREVQKAMAGMFASMFTGYVAICAALGKEPKLNPAPASVGGDGAQFLSIEVAGVNVGAPGWGYSLLRLMGNVAATVATNPEALIKVDMANPVLRWAWSKTSPLVNLAKEAGQQRDYFGNRLEDGGDWVVMLADKVIPIAAQSLLEKTPESNVWVAVGAELFGVRTYPVQPYERLARLEADLAEKYIDWEGDPYLWDDLPKAFKDEIRRKNPDFAQLEEEVTEEWAMKRAADDERNLYIIKKEVGEKFEADIVSLSQKLQTGEITPQEYARLVQDIRGTRATQRDLLWRLGEMGDPEGAEDYERYMIEEAPMEDRFMHTYWDYWAKLIEAEGTVIDWGRVNLAMDTWLDAIDPYYKDYILKYKNDWILDLPEPIRTIELAKREDIDYIIESGYWDIDPEAKTEDKIIGGVFVKGGKSLRELAREKDAKLDAALILWYSPEAIRNDDTVPLLRERMASLDIPEISVPGLRKYEVRTQLAVVKAVANAMMVDPSLADAIKSGNFTESQRSKLLKIYLETYGQPKPEAFEKWLRTELPKY